MAQKHRFYIHDFSAPPVFNLIELDIVHQCIKVLRLHSGDFVYFFNGQNSIDYQYQINDISRKSLQLSHVKNIIKNDETSHVLLYQAIPNKLSKLEYIVQKCCEVGVKKIVFFESYYSQEPKFLNLKKQKRLQKIVIEASEQSHRNTLMELDFEKKLNFSTIAPANNICFHTDSHVGKQLRDVTIKKRDSIQLFVGPEGGFHGTEIEKFKEISSQFICLGDTILRTETTGPVSSFYFIQNF